MSDEKTLVVQVNPDAIQDMPLESLEMFQRAEEGNLKAGEMLDLFDGLVVGGVRGKGYKIRDRQAIAEAISTAFKAGGGWPAMTADLIVATEPAAQSMQSSNHDAMVAMMDALSTALRAAKFAKGSHSWSIKSTRITVAGIDYWGVVVTVVEHG